MKNERDSIVSEIISSYNRHAEKEITCPDFLPDKAEVAEIVTLLRKLLFPGYFEENGISLASAECGVRDLVAAVEAKLSRQICCALNLDIGEKKNCSNMFCRAEETCHAFLAKIPHIIEILITDVQATFDGDPAAKNKHEIIFAYPGIFAISVYRLAHELHLLSVPLVPRMMTEYAHNLTGIDIHPGAEIEEYFFIDHGTGIVIGETTEIGTRVKLYQGVTLGALSPRSGQVLRGKKRHPTLEDGVTVYSNATILGGETVIGKDSVIGGNLFITQSVPPGAKLYLKNTASQG
ncbi:MAG: serine acetyltransferase [Clostridiales bacterium]|nr:serine acetyltransferase [Clostridiales bacterium]